MKEISPVSSADMLRKDKNIHIVELYKTPKEQEDKGFNKLLDEETELIESNKK